MNRIPFATNCEYGICVSSKLATSSTTTIRLNKLNEADKNIFMALRHEIGI
uniref:Uncharacterized protein n=1 Tax=Arion vulgaris TaxID=1028688 RepID=A0A0B7AMF6_9EUPU